MNKHIVYTQISRQLYNQLMDENIIYPKFGISCNACNDKAEKKLIEHLGFNVFFGWEDLNKVEEYKAKFKYSDDPNSKFVLLKLQINEDEIVRTNYYNYADLIFAYSLMNDNETEDNQDFIEALEDEFCEGTTIEKLLNFVFTNLSKEALIQILFKKLDKNDILSVKNLDDILV